MVLSGADEVYTISDSFIFSTAVHTYHKGATISITNVDTKPHEQSKITP